MIWAFIVIFPLLLGGQVTVQVQATDQQHCERVRKLLVGQLNDHRSNATVSGCTVMEHTPAK